MNFESRYQNYYSEEWEQITPDNAPFRIPNSLIHFQKYNFFF